MTLINETFTRILSALILLPVYLFCIFSEYFFNIPLLLITLVISLSALYEFYQIASMKDKTKPFIVIGTISAVAISVFFYLHSFANVYAFGKLFSSFDARFILAVAFLTVLLIAVVQIFSRPLEGAIGSISTTVFGIVFIAMSFSYMILMKALPDGVFYIFALHAVVMLNDSAAYFGGVLFGRHKANIAASPNKSIEGYFTGILVSIIAMIILNEVYITFWDKKLFTIIEAGFIGLFLAVAGNIGDLIESAVKRDGGVKDSGRIIPGHGGMWDVFDALIISLPLFYFYLKIKGV